MTQPRESPPREPGTNLTSTTWTRPPCPPSLESIRSSFEQLQLTVARYTLCLLCRQFCGSYSSVRVDNNGDMHDLSKAPPMDNYCTCREILLRLYTAKKTLSQEFIHVEKTTCVHSSY